LSLLLVLSSCSCVGAVVFIVVAIDAVVVFDVDVVDVVFAGTVVALHLHYNCFLLLSLASVVVANVASTFVVVIRKYYCYVFYFRR